MTLPDDYLTYKNRKKGQDIDRYEMTFAHERTKKHLPGGKALAISIIVPLEYFMLNPTGKPFKHPGAMVTPYPDLRHYTTRDYGNRVGVYRILKAFKENDIQATFAINAALLSRVRPLIDEIQNQGHEIAAHGRDTDAIHWGDIDPQIEQHTIEETQATFKSFDLSPRAWMSPARQQSFGTIDKISQAGFDICLDWESDSVPWTMQTSHGPLTAVPVSGELSDWFILQTKHHSETEWLEQLREAWSMMIEESAQMGAQSLSFVLTPYIIGQPFRIWALRELLSSLKKNDSILTCSVSRLVDAFSEK